MQNIFLTQGPQTWCFYPWNFFSSFPSLLIYFLLTSYFQPSISSHLQISAEIYTIQLGFCSPLYAIKTLCILLSGHLLMNHLHSLLTVSSIRVGPGLPLTSLNHQLVVHSVHHIQKTGECCQWMNEKRNWAGDKDCSSVEQSYSESQTESFLRRGKCGSWGRAYIL